MSFSERQTDWFLLILIWYIETVSNGIKDNFVLWLSQKWLVSVLNIFFKSTSVYRFIDNSLKYGIACT